MRLAALLLCLGCAHVSFTEARPDDVRCPGPSPLDVALHAHSGTTCEHATALVESVPASDICPGWRVLFTGGFAGFTVNHEMAPYAPEGDTYPAERTIVLTALASRETLLHELAHACDVDRGLPNRRDR